MDYSDSFESFYNLYDETYHKILMMREAHFNGDFSLMYSFCSNPLFIDLSKDAPLEFLKSLWEKEQSLGVNLASLVLSEEDRKKIQEVHKMYTFFKDFYAIKNPSLINKQIADLILAENKDPQKELLSVLSSGDLIIPELLKILNNDVFFDPLFPGYGKTPYLILKCLGDLKAVEAIPQIFTLCHRFPDLEDDISLAFYKIGSKAKDFLLNILIGRPITKDHQTAAFLLANFDEKDVITKVKEQLLEKDILSHHQIVLYLLNIALQEDDPNFLNFIKKNILPNVPKNFFEQINLILQDWH